MPTRSPEIVYRFQGPGQVNVFSGPLVLAPDGFLYGVILDFDKPNSAVFRVDVRPGNDKDRDQRLEKVH